MDALSVVRSYFNFYAALDYGRMASHTMDDFVYEDPMFPRLEGNRARALFKLIISKTPNTKITVQDSSTSSSDVNVVNVKYTLSYNHPDTHRPVSTVTTSTLTVTQGKIAKQVNDFDVHEWAMQAQGPLLGRMKFLRNKVAARAKDRLDAFVKSDPELSRGEAAS